jgi:N-acetylmuramoyl-L-alanine amidase
MSDKIILLDPGHGGLKNGEYVTAPRKMYKHENGLTVYEGVYNRQVVEGIKEALKSAGVNFLDVVDSQDDISLKKRVDRANRKAAEVGPKNALYVSVHANAGGGHGYEVYTSPGETASDKIANNFMDFMAEAFPSHRGRKDTTDGDSDKEANFYVLKYTICPAILTESFFMDNLEEAAKMLTQEAINKVVQAHLRTIYAFLND